MRSQRAATAIVASLLLATIGAVVLAQPVHAATIEVTTTEDEDDGADCPGPDCSLREALLAAGDGDVVVLAGGATYALTLGELSIPTTGLVVIEGAGARIQQQTSGARVLHKPAGDLTIRDLEVTGGDIQVVPPATAHGGGVLLGGTGTLTVERSLISNNTAEESGGGISAPSLRLVDSQVSQNHAGSGGGIAVVNTSFVEITRSQVLSNTSDGFGAGLLVSAPGGTPVIITGSSFVANEGAGVGGVRIAPAGATLVNSTIIDNVASGPGSVGGIVVEGTLTAHYATIAGNEGAGTANVWAGELVPFASVFAEPVGPLNCVFGIATVSAGYNASDDDSCNLDHPTDQQGLASVGLGDVPMHPSIHRPPLPGSPLLDMVPPGDCSGPAGTISDDQLGTTRPQGDGCDAGAVEVVVAQQPTTTTSTPSGPTTPTTMAPPPSPASQPAVPASANPTFVG